MTRTLLWLLACTMMLQAQEAPAPAPTASTPTGPTTSASATPLPPPPAVDDSVVAHQGYTATRYEPLWTKSPFSVETPDAPAESVDYALVGVTEDGGVTYANLIEKNSNQHFLISSDKAVRGMTLNSLSKRNGEIFADVTKDGAHLALKQEAVAAGAPPMSAPGFTPPPPNISTPMPGTISPQIPMPGAGSAFPPPGGGGATPPVRPLIRIHRPSIHVPPRPTGNAAPPENAPPPPPPAQP